MTGEALPANATIILSSTVAPSDARLIQTQLDALNKGLTLVDAPVSGGPSRSATGDLAIMASGPEEALAKVSTILQAMSTAAGNKNLHFVRKSPTLQCSGHYTFILSHTIQGSGADPRSWRTGYGERCQTRQQPLGRCSSSRSSRRVRIRQKEEYEPQNCIRRTSWRSSFYLRPD